MFRLLSAAFAVLFLLGAAVQYNDPDPVGWMLVYLAAAVSCALAARGRVRWQLPATVALVALVWAATLVPSVMGKVRPGELVGAWEMKDQRVEEGREMYGLLIIAAWMAVIVTVELRRRARGGVRAE
jgi:Transmembrane family 220, helix